MDPVSIANVEMDVNETEIVSIPPFTNCAGYDFPYMLYDSLWNENPTLGGIMVWD